MKNPDPITGSRSGCGGTLGDGGTDGNTLHTFLTHAHTHTRKHTHNHFPTECVTVHFHLSLPFSLSVHECVCVPSVHHDAPPALMTFKVSRSKLIKAK